MSRTTARAVLVGLVVLGVAAVIVARGQSDRELAAAPIPVTASASAAGSVPAAELPFLGFAAPAVQATGWLNSDPLPPEALAGKVVLYDFWTFGCINCKHTLPWVKAMYARYAPDGLVVLSIHSPEFDYEAEPDSIASFVTDNGIDYPVALDPDHATWKAFENHYWPAFYLHDGAGQLRYRHFGEGAYTEGEDAIRSLLGVDPASPRAVIGS